MQYQTSDYEKALIGSFFPLKKSVEPWFSTYSSSAHGSIWDFGKKVCPSKLDVNSTYNTCTKLWTGRSNVPLSFFVISPCRKKSNYPTYCTVHPFARAMHPLRWDRPVFIFELSQDFRFLRVSPLFFIRASYFPPFQSSPWFRGKLGQVDFWAAAVVVLWVERGEERGRRGRRGLIISYPTGEDQLCLWVKRQGGKKRKRKKALAVLLSHELFALASTCAQFCSPCGLTVNNSKIRFFSRFCQVQRSGKFCKFRYSPLGDLWSHRKKIFLSKSSQKR